MSVDSHSEPELRKGETWTRFVLMYGVMRAGAIILIALLSVDIIFAVIDAPERVTSYLISRNGLLQLFDVHYLSRRVLISFAGGVLYGLFAWHVSGKHNRANSKLG